MKIQLRPMRISDAKRFCEILSNPNFIFFSANPKSIQEEKTFLKKLKTNKYEHGFAVLADTKVVGGLGFKINPHRPYIGEAGYFIDESYHGNGIATKATKLLEKIGFNKLKLERIEILVNPKNRASRRVAEKAGYKKEGILKGVLRQKDGKLYDAVIYAKVK